VPSEANASVSDSRDCLWQHFVGTEIDHKFAEVYRRASASTASTSDVAPSAVAAETLVAARRVAVELIALATHQSQVLPAPLPGTMAIVPDSVARGRELFASSHIAVVLGDFLRDLRHDGMHVRVISQSPVVSYPVDIAFEVFRDDVLLFVVGIWEQKKTQNLSTKSVAAVDNQLIVYGMQNDTVTAVNGYRNLLTVKCDDVDLAVGWLAAYPGDLGYDGSVASRAGLSFAARARHTDVDATAALLIALKHGLLVMIRSRGDLVPPARALVTFKSSERSTVRVRCRRRFFVVSYTANAAQALMHESWMKAKEIVPLRPDEDPVCRVWRVTHDDDRVRVWKAYARSEVVGFNRLVVERMLRDLHPEFVYQEGADVALLSYDFVSAVTLATLSKEAVEACYEVLKAQLTTLHDELQYVHADIRLDNLLLCADASQSKMIDFDLARPIAAAPVYPSRYNHLNERHENAVAGRRIVKNHDRFALWASLFPNDTKNERAFYVDNDNDMGDAIVIATGYRKYALDDGEDVAAKRRR
jgi:hypothetical protein